MLQRVHRVIIQQVMQIALSYETHLWPIWSKWENSKMWSKVVFVHFQILIEMG